MSRTRALVEIESSNNRRGAEALYRRYPFPLENPENGYKQASEHQSRTKKLPHRSSERYKPYMYVRYRLCLGQLRYDE